MKAESQAKWELVQAVDEFVELVQRIPKLIEAVQAEGKQRPPS